MRNNKKYKIIIADDHAVVRVGINATLETQKNLHIEDEASSFHELTELLSKKSYDFLILDLNLGDKNGVPSIRQISDRYNNLPILILSMFPENPYALESIQSGASGYLNKKIVSEELIYAINRIIGGKVYLNEAYKDTLPYGTLLEKTSKSPIDSLAQRELEIFSLITRGMISKKVSAEFGSDQKTIETYNSKTKGKRMENNTKYKIIIADDHAVVRMGISAILGRQENLDIEDEASSFHELTELLSKKSYDFLILDLNLGDKNGVPSIRQISDRYNNLPILILSMFPEDPYALQSIEAGASGYLSKKIVSEELLHAVNKIISGKIYLNEAYRDTLPYGTVLEKTSKSSIESLSQREFEVFSLISTGMTSKEISEELGLSQKTISTYRTRILEKLSLSNTTQLIHFALQNALGEN